MIYVGADPGQSGGIAVIRDGWLAPLTEKMPSSERDLFRFLQDALVLDPRAHAMLERVSSSPQMGVVSAFKFGVGVGSLRMALVAAGIPFDEVSPQKWQTALGCRTGGGKLGQRDSVAAKNITKRRAQQLFPSVTKMTHAIADALLIAEYCRRVHLTTKVNPAGQVPGTLDPNGFLF